MDLTIIWAVILAFAVFAYVVMDGFDLGIGLLFPTFGVGNVRDQAMNSIAPVWDGNETWLVLGGGGLMAAFPLAFAVMLPATYPLIIAMSLGLVFRGVAFEFRWRDPAHRHFWDMAFTGGSALAALAQGMILGALLQGVKVTNDAYSGGWLDWLSPFTLLTGVSVMIGYGLLGATWLVWRTEGSTQAHARKMALRLAIATLVALAAVSAATPFLAFDYYHRWLTMPSMPLAAPVPILVGLGALAFFRTLRSGRDWLPFVIALSWFLLGFVGLGISIFPYIVPRAVTLWQAAAPHSSQLFMLVGVLAILPLILGYTFWAYWVFRGKVGAHGYH
jgi:cytochrome d ubiquinol oxidase subunit II